MMHSAVQTSLLAGFLVGFLGFMAWMTGRPFIFPSLGPTAFALASHSEGNTACRVIGGHFWGVVAGLVSYHLLASGLAMTSFPSPLTMEGARLMVSGGLSVALTVGAMMVSRTVHSPACATTLIVSLGLLPTITDGLIIIAAVILLFGASRALP